MLMNWTTGICTEWLVFEAERRYSMSGIIFLATS